MTSDQRCEHCVDAPVRYNYDVLTQLIAQGIADTRYSWGGGPPTAQRGDLNRAAMFVHLLRTHAVRDEP